MGSIPHGDLETAGVPETRDRTRTHVHHWNVWHDKRQHSSVPCGVSKVEMRVDVPLMSSNYLRPVHACVLYFEQTPMYNCVTLVPYHHQRIEVSAVAECPTHVANKEAIIPSPIPSCSRANRDVGTDAARNPIKHVRLRSAGLASGIKRRASKLQCLRTLAGNRH